jgi:hypothetical protein
VSEFSLTFESLTDKQVRVLAEKHIERFEKMIASGSRAVNVSECQRYLEIWRGVQTKVLRWAWRDQFTAEEKGEIEDALDSGEWDDVLIATTGV